MKRTITTNSGYYLLSQSGSKKYIKLYQKLKNYIKKK